MPVRRQDTACWVLPGEPDGRHFGEADEGREPLPAPCFIAECDGRPGEPCGEQMGNDEYAYLHYASVAEARACAPFEDWAISPDGVVSCPEEQDNAR